jgi:DNA repair exonuclease SbcCD ATPase subunit
MNEPKPVYCIKSRGGRIEKEGDFTEIVGWLRENRINSDDDLRRLGFHVLERDELWARVKDFPEFNQTERQGRRALHRARNRAYLSMVAGIIFVAIGFALICYDQIIPRYTESNRVDEAKAEARSAKELEKTAYDKLKQGREDADKARLQYEASYKQEVSRLMAELETSKAKLNQALAQTRGELVDAKSKLDDVAGRVSADLAAANRKNTSLAKLIEDERSSSKAKLAELEARQKPMRDKLDELQRQNDAFMSLYVRKSEQLKAERDKSIVQKIFGNSASESGD